MFFSPERKINRKILTEGVFSHLYCAPADSPIRSAKSAAFAKVRFLVVDRRTLADSYNLDLSVVFHDKYQIWKNTAGKIASLLVAHFSKLVLQRFVDIVLLQENSLSSLKSRWNMKIKDVTPAWDSTWRPFCSRRSHPSALPPWFKRKESKKVKFSAKSHQRSHPVSVHPVKANIKHIRPTTRQNADF